MEKRKEMVLTLMVEMVEILEFKGEKDVYWWWWFDVLRPYELHVKTNKTNSHI